MKRRRFIQITAAGALAVGVPGAGWSAGHPAALHRLAHPGLLRLLDERRVREIGVAYRRVVSQENDPDTLAAAILGDRGLPAKRAALDLHALLDQQVRDDFTRGRTIRIDGWILSLTEARQCALFTLLYS